METFEMSVSGFASVSRLDTIQLTVGVTVVEKNVDARALLIFQRLKRFCNTFNILAALISGLAIATLTLNEFYPCTTSIARSAEAFLCSSAMCAVISAMLSTMLLFRFEGHKTATRKELAIAWSPLVLLDWVILEFLFGLMLWYADKSVR
jgi:hypothetical protein